MKPTLGTACIATTLAGLIAIAPVAASAAPHHDRHWHGRDRGHGHGHRHYYDSRHRMYWYDNNHRRHYERDSGDALAAGVLGFVLGAAIADSQPRQSYARSHLNDPTWIAHCEAKYRSFDRGSGTYLGYDGKRHYCR